MRIEKILIVSNSIISLYSKHTRPLLIRLPELAALNCPNYPLRLVRAYRSWLKYTILREPAACNMRKASGPKIGGFRV